MDARQRAFEQAQIASMLAEIEATPSGAPAVETLSRQGYRVRFGRPLGGGAFTYPWKVITLRRGYAPHVTQAMLIHELGHVLFASEHRRLWSGSVEQEYSASRFWAQISRELGILSASSESKWLGWDHDLEALSEEIRRPSIWHRVALPSSQRYGLRDKLWALWQAVATVTWVVPLLWAWRSPRDRAAHRDRASETNRGTES
jgi:hypothetical protein